MVKIFRGLSGKKVILPSKDFVRSASHLREFPAHLHDESYITSFPGTRSSRRQRTLTNLNNSHHGHSGVKCSIKANEGLLFCLDKSFMFVPKPATYIQIENISVITMSRVGGAVSASRTFDITISLKGGMGEHQFSNINRYDHLWVIYKYPCANSPTGKSNSLWKNSSKLKTFGSRTRWWTM